MSDAFQGAMDSEYRRQRAAVQAFIPLAVALANQGPCHKSKRGAVLLAVNDRERLASGEGIDVGHGFNGPPLPMRCNGSDACRSACGRVCEHAEAAAMRDSIGHHRGVRSGAELHMLHIKTVGGVAVPSDRPSCEKCSVAMLAHGVAVMWLLTSTGLRAWSMEDFHSETLRNLGLPVIR